MDVLVIGYPLLSMHIRNPRRFVVDIKHSWACIVLEKRGRPWIGGWGEIVRASTPLEQGNRFGSVVRAYARSGSEVGIGENLAGPSPFPFPFCRFMWYFVRVLCGSSESW